MTEPRAERSAASLLARVDASWSDFRPLLGELREGHLDRSVAGGWTVRHVLAHLVAWHDDAATRLAQFHATGAMTPQPDVDPFNEQVAARAGDTSLPRLVTDLERSFRRLRDETARLRDGQLLMGDGWAATEIAANTWEHYEDHVADLRVERAG